jgi:hypothetical protein
VPADNPIASLKAFFALHVIAKKMAAVQLELDANRLFVYAVGCLTVGKCGSNGLDSKRSVQVVTSRSLVGSHRRPRNPLRIGLLIITPWSLQNVLTVVGLADHRGFRSRLHGRHQGFKMLLQTGDLGWSTHNIEFRAELVFEGPRRFPARPSCSSRRTFLTVVADTTTPRPFSSPTMR